MVYNIGLKLESVIPNSTKTFQTFLREINIVLNSTELTEKEFLDAFQPFKGKLRSSYIFLYLALIGLE